MEREAAAAQLADLAGRRDDLAGRLPRRSLRRTVTTACVLGVAIALGALHNDVLTVLTVPVILYAMADLAGVGGWQRAGVLPRRPRPVVALVLAAPLVWPAAILLDSHGQRWALPVAAIAVPLLLATGARARSAGFRR